MSQAVAPDFTNADLDAKDAEIARLRAALAEAERKLTSLRPSVAEVERDEAIALAEHAEAELSDKSTQIAELQEQLHHLYGVEQRAKRAEAALAAALKISDK